MDNRIIHGQQYPRMKRNTHIRRHKRGPPTLEEGSEQKGPKGYRREILETPVEEKVIRSREREGTKAPKGLPTIFAIVGLWVGGSMLFMELVDMSFRGP